MRVCVCANFKTKSTSPHNVAPPEPKTYSKRNEIFIHTCKVFTLTLLALECCLDQKKIKPNTLHTCVALSP